MERSKEVTQTVEHFVLNKKQTGILLVLILIPIITYGYNDTILLIRHSVNVWGSIFEGGGIFNFYHYNHIKTLECKESGLLACDAFYDFPPYIIMAVWNLPLYVIQKFSNVDIASAWPGILYGKMLFVVFLGIGAILIRKICLQLGMPEYKADWGAIIYLTSLFTFSSVYMIGQCDSIGIAFMLAGILYYLRDEKKKFILSFAFAIPVKFFSGLVFAVLLLSKEKRLLYLIRDFLFGISVTVLFKLMFQGTEEKNMFFTNQIDYLLSNLLPLLNGAVPVSVFLTCLLLVYCYLSKEKNPYHICYQCFAILFLFLASFCGTPYWYLYLAPLLSVIIVGNQKYEKEIVILSTIGEASLMIGHYLIFYWCYDVHLVDRTLVGNFLGNARYEYGDFSFRKIEGLVDSSQIFGLASSVFLAIFTGIIVEGLFFSQKNDSSVLEKEQYKKVMQGRILLHVFIAYLPILVYLINRLS